nr:hypothetical protein [Endozoicomonas sp.]
MKNRILFWVLSGFLSGLATLALAISDPDKQGKVYKGLQDVHAIATSQGMDPESTGVRWTIGNPNLIEWLLAPWNPERVNKDLDGYKSQYGSIAATARHVAASAMTNNNISENNFDASGHQLTDDEIEALLALIEQTDYLDAYQPDARAITLSDADALFVPSDTFITKNLTKTANVASDQKSSSTLISANTPVLVLGQFNPIPNLNPAEDSWLAVWRPEFGLKFAKSRHIAFADQSLIDQYSQIQPEDNTSVLKMTTTSRVREGASRLSLGTPILADGDLFMMARSVLKKNGDPQSGIFLKLNNAQLETVRLNVADPRGVLGKQVQTVPLPLNNKNLLDQISNNILKYPAAYVPPSHNENRFFAWGEGTVGPDGERGQDISTMILKSVRPFGKWLPRHSQDQVDEGVSVRPIATTNEGTLEENYQAMTEYCQLGNFVSWGRGNNMACLGSISLQALALLDPQAAMDATEWGGMTEDDRIPLLALTPTGLTTIEDPAEDSTEETAAAPQWFITAKSAVYPVFKKGYLDSFIRNGRSLTFFSYFTPVDDAGNPGENGGE